eukprot:scaffold65394_cov27-Tisochrysis_lutea.AAC.7
MACTLANNACREVRVIDWPPVRRHLDDQVTTTGGHDSERIGSVNATREVGAQAEHACRYLHSGQC